jgi:hypothetical protein
VTGGRDDLGRGVGVGARRRGFLRVGAVGVGARGVRLVDRVVGVEAAGDRRDDRRGIGDGRLGGVGLGVRGGVVTGDVIALDDVA